MNWNQIKNELIIRAFPFDIQWRRNALFDKYLSSVQIKGANIKIKRNLRIVRRAAIILGDNIEIGGSNNIDATAGLMIGDNCEIARGVKISTQSSDSYGPVVIGSGQKISDDVAPGTILPPQNKSKGLASYDGQIVFVLSTGRSGSKSIAKFIGQHPNAEFYHDVFPHMNTWSCDLLYNNTSTEEIAEKINALYNSMKLGKNDLHGQSDQKLAPLVTILSDMFPTSKFIWLIRNPSDFINSAYARGWFDNSEFGYSYNNNEFLKKQVTPSRFDAYHRINGYKLGEFTEEQWKSMTAFERICWYWSFWNELIEKNLSKISSSRSMRVKLDDLESQKKEIMNFLNLDKQFIHAKKVNEAYYPKPSMSQWNQEMKSIFDHYCKAKMNKWGF